MFSLVVTSSMANKKNSSKPNHHTVLFKKILSSFFAKEAMMQIGMNPASMFVSFVSSKQFFWLINRRMAEHYKLNLFDISLDSFDVKIGFGDDPTITLKNIDIYYAYNSSANFIGYKNYSPNIIATWLSMFFAAQTIQLFEDEDDILFNHFIYTIYFLVFIFVSKIKVFPKKSKKQQFDRFVKLFRSFYEVVFENTGKELKPKDLQRIKLLLTDDINIIFSLFHSFKHLSEYFYVINDDNKELISWLLAGELQHKTHEKQSKQYIELYQELCQTPHFSTLEKKIIDLIVPADILIRYLFSDGEGKIISQHILATMYPPHEHHDLIESFIHDGSRINELIELSIQFSTIKKDFFFWLQQYVKVKIQEFTNNKQQISPLMGEHIEESIDEFLSYLSETDHIDTNSLPKNIQIQTITFDKLINFYISFIGGFWLARGDNGYLRLQKPKLLRSLLTRYALFGSQHETVQYYANYFKLYEKNVFYYQYIFNHVRSGKDSFVLPSQASIIAHDSNLFIIQLLNESYWSILLQDLNRSEIKLFIKKVEILDTFKSVFGDDISTLLKYSHHDIIASVYEPYKKIGHEEEIIEDIQKAVSDQEIINLKDRMYCIDFWLIHRYNNLLIQSHIHHYYDAPVLLSLFAGVKETLFWFLLYVQYIISCEQSHQKDYHSSELIDLYCKIVLHSNDSSHHILHTHIQHLLEQYSELLTLRTLLDDNQDYMYIWFNNWNTRLENNDLTAITDILSDEDQIRFIWYLKNISYYNKRFLIPTQ